MSDPKQRKRNLNWFLWWRIDPDELATQVSQYAILPWSKRIRNVSAMCLWFSVIITLLFVYFKIAPLNALVDAILMLILSMFMCVGFRGAFILTMILWTIEKVYIATVGLSNAGVNGGGFVTQFIWWAIYMHAFYFSLIVEITRRRQQAGSALHSDLDKVSR